ncbi:MAG: hypothetical protein EP330_06315 [Deltaproteobacteria bacterium]|nr:MAG: hypothetical protein EP330_06315 [Deltaproteobacteria bacterium]
MRRFAAFFDQREPATPLALYRILVGMSVISAIGSVVWAGLVPVIWHEIADGGMRKLVQGNPVIDALGGPTPQVVWGLVWASLLGGLAMVLGVGGRFSVLVTALAFRAVTSLNNHTGGSYDLLIANALFLCFLAPSTATLSLDCKLRTGAWTDDTPRPSWVRWLIVYQIVLVYWTTGLQKVSSHWVPGGDFSALYYILQQPSWHRFDMRWVSSFFLFTQIGTAVSWFWEVFAPLWGLSAYYAATAEREGKLRAWFNRMHVREVYLVLGVIFHLVIHALMNVGPFSMISLAFYPAFYGHDELTAAWSRLRSKG